MNTFAMALTVDEPAGSGLAPFVTRASPVTAKRPLGTAVEMLAAVCLDHLRHLGPVTDRQSGGGEKSPRCDTVQCMILSSRPHPKTIVNAGCDISMTKT